MFHSLRRTLFVVCAILVFLMLAGATYQGVATALERRRFPHPGRLVDVGGHQLHLHCSGSGTPTVVLEAPATAMSSAWAWVQDDVTQVTRVCSYDRSGLGWSEMGDTPYAPADVPTLLNTLLRDGSEREPFVIVGAELGAAFALLYASRYPDATAALVLVNAPGPPGAATRSPAQTRVASLSPWLARTGVLRGFRHFTRDEAAGLPPEAAGALAAFLNRPDHLTRAAAELSRWDDTMALAASAPQRQSIPVTQLLVEARGPLASLTDRRNAQDVAAAITRTVRIVQAKTSPRSPIPDP